MKLFTNEQEKFIRENYQSMQTDDIANSVGATAKQVRGWAFYNGLRRPKRSLVSEEHASFIRDNYLTMSYSQIGSIVGLTEKQVEGWVRNHIKDRTLKIRQFNDSYFERIDSVDKAYWLGFIYADGWIVHNTKSRNYEFGMELQRRDEYILHRLNEELGGVHEVKQLHRDLLIHNNKDRTISDTSVLRVYQKKLTADLHANGIDFNKTKTGVFPVVEDKFFLDFLRGYMDGDGCIHRIKPSVLGVHITSCTREVLDYINEKVFDLYGIRTQVYSETDRKFRLYWFRQDDVKQLLDLIYQDTDKIMLKRKYDIYKNFYSLAAQ